MSQIAELDSVGAYQEYNNHKTDHPLIGFVDLSKADKRVQIKMHLGIYCIILKDVDCGDLRYGRQNYDYQEGTLLFFSPGQIISFENEGKEYQPKGYALVFHADLLYGTSLAKHIQGYSFFSYQTNEGLHLSEQERAITLDWFTKIKSELLHTIDKYSKKLIVAALEYFLNYCMRFYDRQFITREHINTGTLERFEILLNEYFISDKPQTNGLPSVAYCATALNLSPNYFGDLVKRETGKTAHEYIQARLIDVAKEKIFDMNKSVSEVAYELGFKYPQHFARLFKQRVGKTPNEYRMLN